MSRESKHIVMLAAENDALINGKVGGLADVIRDLPDALADFGMTITVVTPAYGFLHKDNPSKFLSKVFFPFARKTMEGEFWEVKPKRPKQNVTHLVFELPGISGTPIYCQDPPDRPFARDAIKFALFSSAAGQFLKTIHPLPILHLHDWHLGFFLLLRELHPEFEHLKSHKVVFTIHNLSYQGTRPLLGKHASVEQWFPELFKDPRWIERWKDPRYKEPQFNPLSAGIRFADKVSTVSPTYAEEILRPSDHKNGFYGGEGLEQFLNKTKNENRLFGILNGIEYSSYQKSKSLPFNELCDLIMNEVEEANQENPDSYLDFLFSRIKKIRTTQPKIILTSVTRVTEQKVRLLFEKGSGGKSAIDRILEALSCKNGYYLLLGNGTKEFEEKCMAASKRHENMIYLKLYSAKISETLYANGSVFVMPSSFEPCGISQMIAMQNGQPCIVHAVGGLKDTVIDNVNGFQFSGPTVKEKVDNFIAVTNKAVDIYINDVPRWEKIKAAAAGARFDWKESAEKYIGQLYKFP